ncbi:hypothetical protein ACS0TY_030994 [Phlomoides rotata]
MRVVIILLFVEFEFCLPDLPKVMIVLSWNCRGVGHPATIPFLCELVKARKPDVIFLSETLASASRLEDVRLSLNFPNCFTVACNGRSGGLALLWNNNVACSLLSYSMNHIDMEVMEGTVISRITGYYGFSERNRRHMSWSLLKQLACVSSLPWVIIGDFNDLLVNRDMNGSIPHPPFLLRGFMDVIATCGVWDVDLIGHPFTWSRGRGTPCFVEERLDRAMGNSLWHDLYPDAKLFNLVSPISDHSAIVLDWAPVVTRQNYKGFRFENNWLEEKDFPNVVRKCWEGFKDFDVSRRLLATSKTLDLWGKSSFRAFKRGKKELENTIKTLQNRGDSDSVHQFNEAKKKLTDLFIRENIYKKQRAKFFWLRDGDSNTRFFHKMASERSKKNRISKLKNKFDVWVDSQEGLSEIVKEYFTDIFGGVVQSSAEVDELYVGIAGFVCFR